MYIPLHQYFVFYRHIGKYVCFIKNIQISYYLMSLIFSGSTEFTGRTTCIFTALKSITSLTTFLHTGTQREFFCHFIIIYTINKKS